MHKTFKYLFLLITAASIFMLSCSSQSTQSTRTDSRKAFMDSILHVIYDKRGTWSYEQFRKKYYDEKDTLVYKLPTKKYAYAKAYKMMAWAGRGRDILNDRHGKEIILSKKQLKSFLSIIQNKKSYGAGTAACFDPKLAVVFCDSDSIPMEYIAVCLDCNSADSYPSMKVFSEMNSGYGFSPETRIKLRQLFSDWGLPYEEYSHMFDSTEEWKKYVEQQEKE